MAPREAPAAPAFAPSAASPVARYTLRRRGLRPLAFVGAKLVSCNDEAEGRTLYHRIEVFEQARGGFVASALQIDLDDRERVLAVETADTLAELGAALRRKDAACLLPPFRTEATGLDLARQSYRAVVATAFPSEPSGNKYEERSL
jgi:hypothetical protein